MNFFSKLWADDAGVVTIEYLVLGVFLAISLIVGVATLQSAINAELSELAQTILSFNSSYSADGFSTCAANHAGSAANDVNGTITATLTAPATPATVEVTVCP